jgi:hypothetical protein
LCQPSYDPHSLHNKTSTRTSNQITSQVAAADRGEISSFNSSIETSLDSLSNQDSESLSPPLNNGFTELQCEEELKYEYMAQNSTGHGRVAIPLVLNKQQKKQRQRWDERFKELVDFKKINGHVKVPTKVGQLGRWVSYQRRQYRLLQEGKDSLLTKDKREKLESIGFKFDGQLTFETRRDQRYQELFVKFKKINGHAKIPTGLGQLGRWVSIQPREFHLLQEGKDSQLTIDNCEKLESIRFEFKWNQRFQELVKFKKINGHANVPTHSGRLGAWVSNQRTQYSYLQAGKYSQLTIDRYKKLESIGFKFKYRVSYISWDQRFQELVDYKKINGDTNVHHYGLLGTWIRYQRMQYRLFQEGKHSALTIDKREKLESIGFDFKLLKTRS